MFGFGRSAELDRREQALNMREQELNQREFELRKLEYSLRVQEQKLSAMELKLENQITEATKTRDKYQAERQMLLYTREEKLANADKQAAKIVANRSKRSGKSLSQRLPRRKTKRTSIRTEELLGYGKGKRCSAQESQ